MGTVAMVRPPVRSMDQRMRALERGNAVRGYRKDLKLKLKAGERDVVLLIMDPPARIDTMRVFDLLLAVPKFGRVKVGKLLRRVEVSPSKTVGGLSVRQRRELAFAVSRAVRALPSR